MLLSDNPNMNDERYTDISPLLLANDGEKKQNKWIGHYSSSHKIVLVEEGALPLPRPGFRLCHKYGGNFFGLSRRWTAWFCMGSTQPRWLTISSSEPNASIGVYNFPHVGFRYREGNGLQIELNKRLVKVSFGNGRALLRMEGGEVLVTHKTGECYDKWNLVKKAEKEGC